MIVLFPESHWGWMKESSEIQPQWDTTLGAPAPQTFNPRPGTTQTISNACSLLKSQRQGSVFCSALELRIWILGQGDLMCADLWAMRYGSTIKQLLAFLPTAFWCAQEERLVRGVLGIRLALDVGLRKQIFSRELSMVGTFFSFTKLVINVLIWIWALCRQFTCMKLLSFFFSSRNPLGGQLKMSKHWVVCWYSQSTFKMN